MYSLSWMFYASVAAINPIMVNKNGPFQQQKENDVIIKVKIGFNCFYSIEIKTTNLINHEWFMIGVKAKNK